jgi:thioredoxin 1
MPKEIKGSEFQKEVLDNTELVLVDFWAPWCGPCKAIAPVLEKLATKLGTQLKVVKVNVDEEDSQVVAANYGVKGIPNLILFKNGKLLEQKVGSQSETVLTAWVQSHLPA